MDSSNPGPLLGRFKAENAENILKAYRIVMDVKETGKSYILQLVEFESRYSASHISHLFSKSKRVVLRKAKGGHAIRKWGDGTFTFYPFQAGIPFYFEKLSTDAQGEATPEHGGVDNRDVCESRACAYNRDGICRFSLVHDRPPNITEAETAPNLCPGHISPKKCDKSLTTWKMGVKEVSPLRYTLKSHPWGGFSFDSLES